MAGPVSRARVEPTCGVGRLDSILDGDGGINVFVAKALKQCEDAEMRAEVTASLDADWAAAAARR